MLLLADENVPRVVVDGLRAAAHDVSWIQEIAPGISDEDVLAMARADERVLVTFDKDFGELVYRRGAASSPGIILFRFLADSPVALTREIVSAVGSRDDWAGSFSVVEEGRIRMRPLPP